MHTKSTIAAREKLVWKNEKNINFFEGGGKVMEGEILKFSKNHFRRAGCRSRIPNLNPFGLLEVDEKSGEPKRLNENKKRLASEREQETTPGVKTAILRVS